MLEHLNDNDDYFIVRNNHSYIISKINVAHIEELIAKVNALEAKVESLEKTRQEYIDWINKPFKDADELNKKVLAKYAHVKTISS